MFYDIASFSGWLTIALVIGGATGWATWSDASRDGWFVGWAKWAAIAFIVGILVAILKILPGRAGLWLELALLMAMFYVAGCFIGGWLHGLFGARESAPAIAPAPVAAATVEIFGSAPESYPGARPAHAAASLGADDLTQISGIGTIDQKHLNDIGVHRYGQVAAWSGDNAIWVDHHLSNAGRIEREGWIASAATLAGVGRRRRRRRFIGTRCRGSNGADARDRRARTRAHHERSIDRFPSRRGGARAIRSGSHPCRGWRPWR
jgi:predicted flap endonuclease-1-like 5' DNA nuclease